MFAKVWKDLNHWYGSAGGFAHIDRVQGLQPAEAGGHVIVLEGSQLLLPIGAVIQLFTEEGDE